MNQTISNTLFHFTSQLATLQAILKSSMFCLKLNQRQWRIKNSGGTYHVLQYEIPMTCLTETPVQFLKGHSRTFGNYGIGLKIGWAVENGAQNVIYCEHNDPNDYGNTLLDIFDHQLKLTGTNLQHRFNRQLFDSLVGATEQMVYRPEREWRFIGRLTDTATKAFTPTQVNFAIGDVDVLLCPKSEIPALSAFADSIWGNGHGVKIQALS